ncbi:MAG: hypothetical protein KIT57_03690 [Blastocatellales bacterium]|nr:hypothetical protein [Blastocatellales bacterium]
MIEFGPSLLAPDQPQDIRGSLTHGRAEDFKEDRKEVYVPKRNIPKPDRGRKHNPTDLDACVEAINDRIRTFFNTPINERIRETPLLINQIDEKEAQATVERFESLAEWFEDPFGLLPKGFYGMFLDDQIRKHLAAAVRLLLHQLMIEAMVCRDDWLTGQDVAQISKTTAKIRDLLGIDGTPQERIKAVQKLFDGAAQKRQKVYHGKNRGRVSLIERRFDGLRGTVLELSREGVAVDRITQEKVAERRRKNGLNLDDQLAIANFFSRHRKKFGIHEKWGEWVHMTIQESSAGVEVVTK